MADRKCKDCKHWHKIDYVPGQVTIVEEEKKPGECRFNPPGMVVLGPGVVQCVYPHLKPDFVACDQFAEREPG